LSDDPFLNRLAGRFAVGDSRDPATDAGAVVTMLLGNALFRDNINVALGRPCADERLIDALDRARIAFAAEAAGEPASEDSRA